MQFPPAERQRTALVPAKMVMVAMVPAHGSGDGLPTSAREGGSAPCRSKRPGDRYPRSDCRSISSIVVQEASIGLKKFAPIGGLRERITPKR